MSYEKHNFRSGDILYANQLNAMDDGIKEVNDHIDSLSQELNKLDQSSSDLITLRPSSFVLGSLWDASSGSAYGSNRTDYSYATYDVEAGKTYYITGKSGISGTVYPLVTFYNINNTKIGSNGTDGDTGYTTERIVIPDNVVRIIVNSANSQQYPIQVTTELKILDWIGNLDPETYAKLEKISNKVDHGYFTPVMNGLILEAKKNPFQWKQFDKGYISFVFDGLQNDIDSPCSIFEEYGYPLVIAAIPSRRDEVANGLSTTRGSYRPNMTMQQITSKVVDLGGEVMANNSNVITSSNQYDSNFMYDYFISTKKQLENWGLTINGIVRTNGTGQINSSPEIERWLIGNYEYSDLGYTQNHTLERISINQNISNIKTAIDDAVENHKWIRIMARDYTYGNGTTFTGESDLKEILNYCKNKNIEVVTYKYMYDRFGSNKLETLASQSRVIYDPIDHVTGSCYSTNSTPYSVATGEYSVYNVQAGKAYYITGKAPANGVTYPVCIFFNDTDSYKIESYGNVGNEELNEYEVIAPVNATKMIVNNSDVDNIQLSVKVDADISEKIEMIEESIKAIDNNKFVTPDMYGAVGDGIQDDTDAMIACFNYANEHKLPVIWHGKTIYMKTATETHCPIINTNVDFSGCTIIMDAQTVGKTIFKVGEDPELLDSYMEGRVLNQETSDTIFQEWPNSYILVESLHYLGKRFNQEGTETWYRHKQGVLTNDYGAIQPVELFREISEYKHVYRIDKLSEPIDLCFGEIEITSDATASAMIVVQRANVTVHDIRIIPHNQTYVNINITPIRLSYAYNVIVKNVIAVNLPINSDSTVTSYIVDIHNCYKVTLENINATKGWGAVASHFSTDMIMRNCHVGRADFHYGTYGINIVEGCSFVSFPCKIEIGYGDGTVIVRDCIFYKRKEGNIYNNDFIQFRNDFAIMFSGKLIFENNTVQLYDNPDRNDYSWLMTYRTYGFDSLIDWAPNNFPYIYIDKLLIRSEGSSSVFDYLQILGVNNAYTNSTIEVGEIHIECENENYLTSLMTDFTGFDTTNARLYLKHCKLTTTGFEGTIFKDAYSKVSVGSAKVYDLYTDSDQLDLVYNALEVFDDDVPDNMEELTPTEVVEKYIMNLNIQTTYGPNDKYAHEIFDIEGDYPYLVSGHSTSNAASGNGALCGFYSADGTWLGSYGRDNFVKYENYRVQAPVDATKLIVNRGNDTIDIKVYKLKTKSASSKLNRMQSFIDEKTPLINRLEPLPDIMNIVLEHNDSVELTPTESYTGYIYNLINKNTWNAGTENYMYAVYSVEGLKKYHIDGNSTSNAEAGNGALCAFYDLSDNLIGEPLGRERETVYRNFEVIAPQNAVKLIVNKSLNTVTISVREITTYPTHSEVLEEIRDGIKSVKPLSSIMDVVDPYDETVSLDRDELHIGYIYNLISRNTWNAGTENYMYAVYTVTEGTTYYVDGNSTSSAEAGNGALCAFYNSSGDIIGEPYGRDKETVYKNFEVVAPEGAVKLIVNRSHDVINIDVKRIVSHPSKSIVLDNIQSKLDELKLIPQIMDVVDEYSDTSVISYDTIKIGYIYNLVIKTEWNGGNNVYNYAIYTVEEGKTYYVTGSSTSNAEEGNGALCAFYDSSNNLIGEPYGRSKGTIYRDFEVTAPTGSTKLIVNKNQASVEISVKELVIHPAHSQTISDILDRITELEENGGGGGGSSFEFISLIADPSFAEIGSTVTDVDISYELNRTPTELTIDGNSITPQISGTESLMNLSIIEDTSWVFEAVAKKAVATKTVSIKFVNNIYYGVSVNPGTVDDIFILGLNKQLKDSKTISFTITAGNNQYIWFALPERLGTPSFYVGGFAGGFELATTISHQNASGYTENYLVYKSVNTNLGNTTVDVR